VHLLFLIWQLIFIRGVRVAAGFGGYMRIIGGYMRIIRSLPTTRRARTFAFVIGLLGAVGASQPSMAVTIGFGTSPGTVTPYVESGFTVDIARIVNGNCLSGARLALNNNEAPILSKVGGGVFTLDSFWFQLVGNGNPNQLTVTSYSDSTLITTIHLAVPTYTHNTGYPAVSLFARTT
jgi:hypothetical protein